jgi:N-acetyl sugar amidotransferase
MKICKSCVIPETAETHKYDKKGICSVCTQIKVKNEQINWSKRKIELDELVLKYRNQNEYDCIVPFSGGKDSVFTLYYLVKEYKLRPLVVRFDHNFLRNKVIKNTEKVISKLGVDFINYKPNFNLVKKLMIESLIRRGDFCWHCHVGVHALPIRIAIEKKIPLLFYGEPAAEYASYSSYNQKEELNVEKFNKQINLGINAEDMFEMLKERYPNSSLNFKDFKPYIFPSERELLENNIKAVQLGDYIPWDVKKQVELIKNELDWEGDQVEGIPPEYDYEKIECMMQGVRDYLKFLKRGFGRTAHLVSIDIRNQRLTRDEGLDLTRIYDGKKPQSLSLFLKITNMSEKEFYEIVKKHVIAPHQIPDFDDFLKSSSNIKTNDYEDWAKKFI